MKPLAHIAQGKHIKKGAHIVQIVTIANQKGGTAKSTTAAALAQAAAATGRKCLAIDLDPQGNLSFFLQADTGKGLHTAHARRAGCHCSKLESVNSNQQQRQRKTLAAGLETSAAVRRL